MTSVTEKCEFVRKMRETSLPRRARTKALMARWSVSCSNGSMLSASFLKEASELLVPYAGTDLMAPLLYQLVRTTRPRSVLEAGSGYSTLFLLQALHDNAVEYEEQKKAFLAKTERLKVAMKEGGKPLWG